MYWNKKFNYPVSSRVTINGSRYYNINNTKLPSVTEILKATESEEKKNSLLRWRNKVGEDEANRIMTVSSVRGTQMHKYIEEYLVGQSGLELTSEINEPKLMSNKIIRNGLCNLNELWGAEVTLSFPSLYAGTADACGLYNSKESILDFKQSNKPKKIDYIQDYFLQLGAYTLAHNVVYESNITSGVILLCTVDNLFQDFKIQGPELLMYQNLFLGRLKKFNEMNNLS